MRKQYGGSKRVVPLLHRKRATPKQTLRPSTLLLTILRVREYNNTAKREGQYAPRYGVVAQWIEHSPPKRRVVGPIPTSPTIAPAPKTCGEVA